MKFLRASVVIINEIPPCIRGNFYSNSSVSPWLFLQQLLRVSVVIINEIPPRLRGCFYSNSSVSPWLFKTKNPTL